MFRPLQKKFFLTDKILKKIFLQKSLLPCEKHIRLLLKLLKITDPISYKLQNS
jgi:hypothetical protein